MRGRWLWYRMTTRVNVHLLPTSNTRRRYECQHPSPRTSVSIVGSPCSPEMRLFELQNVPSITNTSKSLPPSLFSSSSLWSSSLSSHGISQGGSSRPFTGQPDIRTIGRSWHQPLVGSPASNAQLQQTPPSMLPSVQLHSDSVVANGILPNCRSNCPTSAGAPAQVT